MTTLLELPSTRQEGWRWSNLSALPSLAAGTGVGLANVGQLPWIDCGEAAAPRLLFVDGVLDAAHSRLGPVRVEQIDARADDHPLARHVPDQGWRLRLGRDEAPAGPVQIVHISTGAADHLGAEVELDVDAQASVVETFIGEGWANRLTHFRLFKGARLMLSRRLLGTSGFVSLTDRAVLGEGASLVAATLAAGAVDTRLDGRLQLAGEGAYAEYAGALLARGAQRHDANLVVHHAVPNGTSRQLWRSVTDDQAVASVAARVEVARGAQKTDGEQSLKGIMLSRTSTINLKPELEIFADDVKCAHGATVGELDRNALFYLASRGVSPEEATGLLTRAFVADVLDRIGEEAVREVLAGDVEAWFNPSPLAGEGGVRRQAVGG